MYSLHCATLCLGLSDGYPRIWLQVGWAVVPSTVPPVYSEDFQPLGVRHKFWVHLIPCFSSEPTGWQHGCDNSIESFCIKRSWLSESCVKHRYYVPVLENIKSQAIGADERKKDVNMGMTSDLSGTQDVGKSARHPRHHLFCEEICHTF